MKITVNGEPASYNTDTGRWSCKNLVAKNMLDLHMERILGDIPPLAYTGAISDEVILKDLQAAMGEVGFDFRFEEVTQSDHASRMRMIETEEGNKQMFGSDENFVSYFYTIKK